MKADTSDVERPKLFGCLVLHADSLQIQSEFLMQGACEVLGATNKPSRRPTIRSIAPVTRPPDDIGMFGDRVELRGEAHLEIDATGRVVGVPYSPETGAFDADTTSINSWLFLTFAAGLQFQPEPEVPTTIVGLEYHALRKGESVVVEVTESLGCNARTWRASWPTSPEWRVIEEP
jgi:hypothetical protein